MSKPEASRQINCSSSSISCRPFPASGFNQTPDEIYSNGWRNFDQGAATAAVFKGCRTRIDRITSKRIFFEDCAVYFTVVFELFVWFDRWWGTYQVNTTIGFGNLENALRLPNPIYLKFKSLFSKQQFQFNNSIQQTTAINWNVTFALCGSQLRNWFQQLYLPPFHLVAETDSFRRNRLRNADERKEENVFFL